MAKGGGRKGGGFEKNLEDTQILRSWFFCPAFFRHFCVFFMEVVPQNMHEKCMNQKP